MNKIFLIVTIFSVCACMICPSAFAAQPGPDVKSAPPPKTEQSVGEKVKEKAGQAYDFGAEKANDVKEVINDVKLNRAGKQWSIIANYSLYEMWVLNKYGFAIAYTPSAEESWEFEHMRGTLGYNSYGIDLGEIREQRFSLLHRSFAQRNTFNFLAGIYLNKFEVSLGNSFLQNLGSGERSRVELLQLDTAGLTLGLGNRWQTSGRFVWGLDWFVINWPITVMNENVPYRNSGASDANKARVDTGIRTFEKFPSLGVLKIQLGLSF